MSADVSVVRGEPSDEELAAVLAVLAAKMSEARQARDRGGMPPMSWASYWRVVREPVRLGRDAWRSTYRW
ncbi:MAG: acyl-CoA carboxylase subunit epsilon [Actinobacteria bacterium]|nr:acyl-CoA carboxylase subunit epsilon [Actinomycetota bacterium]